MNQKGLTKEDLLHVPKACILQAPKLELNLSRISIWPARFHRASAPSTMFSLRKQKCEAPSLCCLWQDSMFTNQLWNTGSKLPWSMIVKEPLRHSQLQLETAALRWFALFFFGSPQSLPFLHCFVFCAGEGALVTEHQALHSSAVWQCRFLTLVFPLGREGLNTRTQLCPDSEDTACCFHYCTRDLHMQGKGGMSNTP